MSDVRIPTQSQLDAIRSQWRNDGAEGETIHWLCDAVEYLKAQTGEDTDQMTLPLIPREDPTIETLVGVGDVEESPSSYPIPLFVEHEEPSDAE